MFGMGDHISQAMKDAIAAFKGPVTHCPEGSAEFASYVLHAAGGYQGFLAGMGIMVKPVEWTWKLSERQSHLGMDRTIGSQSTELRDNEMTRLADRCISYEEIAEQFDMTPKAVYQAIWRTRAKQAA